MPQKHLKTLLYFAGASSSLLPHTNTENQPDNYICYTVLIFYVFPPVQIKPHVGGLKSNKTYYNEEVLKLNTNTGEKVKQLCFKRK